MMKKIEKCSKAIFHSSTILSTAIEGVVFQGDKQYPHRPIKEILAHTRRLK
jgi:hypothetical protein